MNILSPNEKVVFLRKKFKISQNELTMGKFSRSYLGMVEIGKTNFNENFASNIVENFNSILKQRNIDFRITLDFLMKSKVEQIKEIAADFIERIENDIDFETVASEIENFIGEYSLDIKIELYKKLADKLYLDLKFNRALFYYLRIFNDVLISRNYDILSKVSLNIVRISYNLEKHDEVIRIEKIIKHLLKNFDEEGRIRISYNFGITFYKVDNFSQALKYFDKFLKFNKSSENSQKESRNFKGYLMKARTLVGLREYQNAINILRSLLKTYYEHEKKVHTNMYLMLTYVEMNEMEKVKYYFRKNRKLIEEYGHEVFADELLMHFFELGKTALYLNRNEIAIKYFEKALDIKIEYLDVTYELVLDYRLNSIKNLLNLYSKRDLAKVEKLFEKYLEITKLSSNFKAGYNFIKYYNKYNFKNKINETIEILMDA